MDNSYSNNRITVLLLKYNNYKNDNKININIWGKNL